MKRKYQLYGVLFIIAGVACLVWTAIQFSNTLSFQSSELHTVGTVLSVETKLVGGRTKTLVDIPTITFTANGRPYTFISDIHLNPYSIQANVKIPVAYDQNDPNIAHIDEPHNFTLWGFVVLDFVFSLILFLFSWVCFAASKDKNMQVQAGKPNS